MSGIKVARARVLCVDDEPNVLDGLNRTLRQRFEIVTAVGSLAGLRTLESGEPFAVVVSDLRMPQMDGIQFLVKVRECAKDTARVLLTGNADISAAVSAVNEGNIFRFLTKPCPSATLISAIDAAVEQHQLVTAERVLLEKTLLGSVKMLTEALALASPVSFGRAIRIKDRAGALAERIGSLARWKIEMAAMLSQVVCITLPPETLERWQSGGALDARERAMVERLPEVSDRLLSEIPRIEEVRTILRRLGDPHRGGGDPLPPGTRILRAVLDAEMLEAKGESPSEAVAVLKDRGSDYDPEVLLAMLELLGSSGSGEEIREVSVQDLRQGMVLLRGIQTADGKLLLAHGNELSAGMIERLRNLVESVRIREPIRVVVRRVEVAQGLAASRRAS